MQKGGRPKGRGPPDRRRGAPASDGALAAGEPVVKKKLTEGKVGPWTGEPVRDGLEGRRPFARGDPRGDGKRRARPAMNNDKYNWPDVHPVPPKASLTPRRRLKLQYIVPANLGTTRNSVGWFGHPGKGDPPSPFPCP